jgi:hypothetical protein
MKQKFPIHSEMFEFLLLDVFHNCASALLVPADRFDLFSKRRHRAGKGADLRRQLSCLLMVLFSGDF